MSYSVIQMLSALMQGKRADLALCTWRGGALTNGAYMSAFASGDASDPRQVDVKRLQKDADNLLAVRLCSRGACFGVG